MNSLLLFQKCQLIKHPDFSLFSNLPNVKKEKLIKNFSIDPLKNIVAIVDTSLSNNCSFGLVISEDGLYWKNYWSTPSKIYFLDWNRFKSTKITLKEHNLVSMDYQMDFDAYGCLDFKDKLIKLLHSLQESSSPKMDVFDITDISKIPQSISTSIKKQLSILEIMDSQFIYLKSLHKIMVIPYDLEKSIFNNEEDYYNECTKQILLQINTILQEHTEYKETLLKLIAYTIEDISQDNILWGKIHQKMNSINSHL